MAESETQWLDHKLYSFQRYLASKKSVDDRALNRSVWQALLGALSIPRSMQALRVVEAGAGIGTMVERLLEWACFARIDYTGLDADARNIQDGMERLPAWAVGNGFRVKKVADGWQFHKPGQQAGVRFIAMDVFDFSEQAASEQHWDLLVAHAFLDLVDLETALPRLFALLAAGGLFYFTINFDGATILEPEIDRPLDERLMALYHKSMDERSIGGKPRGDSRTGRRLFHALEKHGGEILYAGPSDWVVFPGKRGYQKDEAYFLHFIVHTIQTALAGDPRINQDALDTWIVKRHAQIEATELVYIAHQMDFCGRYLP